MHTLKVVLPNFLHKNPQWTPPPLCLHRKPIYTHINQSFMHYAHIISLTKESPAFFRGKYQHQKVFLFLWLIPHFFSFPTTEVPDTWSKQEVEWHRAKFSSARWFLLYWCASYLPPIMLIPSIYPPKKKVLKGRELAWAVRKGIETKTINGCDRDWQSRRLKQSGNEGERGEERRCRDCVHHCPPAERDRETASNSKCRAWRRRWCFRLKEEVDVKEGAPPLFVEWNPPPQGQQLHRP